MNKKDTELSTEELLEQRGNIYGSYKVGAMCRSQVIEAMVTKYQDTQGILPSEELKVMFYDLALKLIRFASDPKHEDSLNDLAGYSKLINDAIQGRDRVDSK